MDVTFSSRQVAVTNILEVIYRSALRFSTGLPKWTPVPILMKEAEEYPIALRLKMLVGRFWIKHLFFVESSLLYQFLVPFPTSPRLKKPVSLNYYFADQFNDINFKTNDLIPTYQPFNQNEKVEFPIDCLPLQSKEFPTNIIKTFFIDHKNKFWQNKIVIATDASKSLQKCTIAIANIKTGESSSGFISYHNCIFTGEVMALIHAISHFVNEARQSVLLTDSISFLKAKALKLQIGILNV
ncbi:hypothetical protein AVEN_158951-1 [Araneus ventricosus]|uniref:RNase H type-1 domain-containing protein n=1 Tax=Araneus ventricosus TaxID=182803 RepID=A0A4Y2B9Y3_ARAVE|nr:hypothetical protein AVEN_158951-1 [Araneus ventricosus]